MSMVVGLSQNIKVVQLYYVDSKNIETWYLDSLQMITKLNNLLGQYHASGYITAQKDSMACKQDSCSIFIYKGQKYLIKQIDIGLEHKTILESNGFRKLNFEGKSPDTLLLKNMVKQLVSHQNNIGYPFAYAQMDKLRFDVDGIRGRINVVPGRKIFFDTIAFTGALSLKPQFFSRMFRIEYGKPYDHSKVLELNTKFKNLPYLQSKGEPRIQFINDKAIILLDLEPKKANRFDFIFGILPNTSNSQQRFTFIADFAMELHNSFRYGEYTMMQYKRLQPETSELLLKSSIPFIGKLPFGSYLDFRIFRNSVTNLDLFLDAGTQYNLGGINNFKVYYSYRSSSLIDINIEQIKQSNRLPQRLDVSYSGLGVGLEWISVDNRWNPSKGYTISTNTGVGVRNIRPNLAITSIEGFELSYDSLILKSAQLEADIRLARYLPISTWATVKTGFNAGIKYNQNGIITNELLRIGGNKILRGFDEETLFVDRYGYISSEFRILLDSYSYLSLPFIELGSINVFQNGVSRTTTTLGVGLSLNFNTAGGQFGLSLAAGKLGTDPLDFSRMKIHLGYLSRF